MRLLRETLLSLFVMGVVLYLYLVAGGIVLCGICGFVSHRDKPAAVHHSKMAADVNSTALLT